MKKNVFSLLLVFLEILLVNNFAFGKSDVDKENDKQQCVCSNSSVDKGNDTNKNIKFYGFVRSFMIFDTRESKTGAHELFYYIPKDNNWKDSYDVNSHPSFRFVALSSRLGLDISDKYIGNTLLKGRIEGDFYNMNGNVSVFRLRQAYVDMHWNDWGSKNRSSIKLRIGQTWHPFAEDKPYSIALDSGAPFTPFSRTPLLKLDYSFAKILNLSFSALYPMQYLPIGPFYNKETLKYEAKASTDYVKYSLCPEFYFGAGINTKFGLKINCGLDILSIKPRKEGINGASKTVKVKDRLTCVSPMFYVEYKRENLKLNAKTVYASAGEHFNMLSGYGVSKIDNVDGSWQYTPMRSTVSFASIQYGKKVQLMAMAGFLKNLGTQAPLVEDDSTEKLTNEEHFFISGKGEKNLNAAFRVTPSVKVNMDKLSFGMEYAFSSVQYGTWKRKGFVSASNGLVQSGLHWVNNHRVLFMLCYNF